MEIKNFLTEFDNQKRFHVNVAIWNPSSDRRKAIIAAIAANPILTRNYTPNGLTHETRVLFDQLVRRVQRLAEIKSFPRSM